MTEQAADRPGWGPRLLDTLLPPGEERRDGLWIVLGALVLLVAMQLFGRFESAIGWQPDTAAGLNAQNAAEVLFAALVVWLMIRLGAPYGMVVFACVTAFTTALTLLVMSAVIGPQYGGFDPVSGTLSRVIENLARAGGVVVGAFLARYVSGLQRTREEQRKGVVLAGWYLLGWVPVTFLGTAIAAFSFAARPPVTYGWHWWGLAQPWMRGGAAAIVVFFAVYYLNAPRSMWLPWAGAWLALVGGSLLGLLGSDNIGAGLQSTLGGAWPGAFPMLGALAAVMLATWLRRATGLVPAEEPEAG